MQTITVISVYERKSSRHKWQLLIERPIAKKDFIIQWAKDWHSRLSEDWKPRQLGYIIHDRPRIGERTWWSLPCNDPRVVRINSPLTNL